MSCLTEAREILENVYLELATEALKKKDKPSGTTIRCCECGRCDVTLRKIHSKVYACVDCVNKKTAVEVVKRHGRK